MDLKKENMCPSNTCHFSTQREHDAYKSNKLINCIVFRCLPSTSIKLGSSSLNWLKSMHFESEKNPKLKVTDKYMLLFQVKVTTTTTTTTATETAKNVFLKNKISNDYYCISNGGSEHKRKCNNR